MPCRAAARPRQRAAELCHALRATMRETLYEDAALLAAADHLAALLPNYRPPAPPADEPARRRRLVQLLGRHDTVEDALAAFHDHCNRSARSQTTTGATSEPAV